MAVGETLSIKGPVYDGFSEILTPAALEFVANLQRKFGPAREKLLAQRAERQKALDEGAALDFLPETAHVRAGDWQVAPAPPDLLDRRVEITGPVDRKMIINALNSGAKVFMADFEDANSPTWRNLIEGQINLIDAIERSIEFVNPDGRVYRLNQDVATLLVRPRGWHLPENHLLVDGVPISASLFDFGLYFFHNAHRLVDAGTGPYFYLPKLQSHLEARLWNDVFVFAQDQIGISQGTIKATVLVETILAAFEMEEILYELRDHSAGLNAGRWDFIFSIIKTFRHDRETILPDRAQITMSVPFMRAYTNLLVKTCHRRGAHAIGGMAAFIPSRRDAQVNEVALAKVRDDKLRESGDGFDGTWVAHPDLVPVAKEIFDRVLGDGPNQVERLREDVATTANDLLNFAIDGGSVSEEGLRSNITVAILYIESWLRGVGAAALFNLMEDAATAEISRSQVWQWIRYGVSLKEGPQITQELVEQYLAEELEKIRAFLGPAKYDKGRFGEAVDLFKQVSLGHDFEEFLTLPAYRHVAAD